MDEVITPETLPDAPHVSAPDGGGADSPGSISLSALKEVLGKDFPDADSALKSVKDTYRYVGSQAQYQEKISKLASALNTDEQGVLSTIDKLMEDISNNAAPEPVAPATPAPVEGQYVTKEDMFFMKNENLADLRDVLTPIKNASEETRAMGWDQFVQSDTAKKILEPINAYREVESKKSVLDASPRLGAATDKVTQAKQMMSEAVKAQQSGDYAGANANEFAARQSAISSVIDAYDLK
jgi:hypothetical protein